MELYTPDIRGVTISFAAGRLLLPNTTVSEVITYSPPQPYEDVPEWLLGRVVWRGWQVPVYSFTKLIGMEGEESEETSKIAILKALSGNPRMPFVGTLTQGFPRLTTITPDSLEQQDNATVPEYVNSVVSVAGDEAYIPELNAIEKAVAKALDI